MNLVRRPATTFLVGLLTKILIPILTLILVVTGVGIFIVPFLFAAVLFAGIVGKAALLQYFGQQLGKQFSHGTPLKPLLALLVGAALLTAIYLVPVLGLLALLTTGLWALGAAVMALFGGTRREMPQRPQPQATPPSAAYAAPGQMNVSSATPAVGLAPMPGARPMAWRSRPAHCGARICGTASGAGLRRFTDTRSLDSATGYVLGAHGCRLP